MMCKLLNGAQTTRWTRISCRSKGTRHNLYNEPIIPRSTVLLYFATRPPKFVFVNGNGKGDPVLFPIIVKRTHARQQLPDEGNYPVPKRIATSFRKNKLNKSFRCEGMLVSGKKKHNNT